MEKEGRARTLRVKSDGLCFLGRWNELYPKFHPPLREWSQFGRQSLGKWWLYELSCPKRIHLLTTFGFPILVPFLVEVPKGDHLLGNWVPNWGN